MVAQRDQIRAGLGRRIRRTRLERIALERGSLLDRAVDLIGRDVEELADTDLIRHVAQHVRPDAVRADERRPIGDRSIDVGLRREVHHRVVTVHRTCDIVDIADVGVDELATRVVEQVTDRRQVPRIGQGVVDRHLVVGRRQDVADIVRSDESGGSGDEQSHDGVLSGCSYIPALSRTGRAGRRAQGRRDRVRTVSASDRRASTESRASGRPSGPSARSPASRRR